MGARSLGAVTARGDEAHVLVSTTAATNIIADTLCARQDVIDKAPETVRDFVHGWLDGIEMIKNDPAAAYAIVAKALKLDTDTVSGMLSGLKLTPYADNAQFYGLSGGKAHYETLFDTAFVIWRKKGLVTRPVEAKDWVDTRFLRRSPPATRAQKVEEPKIAAKAPSKNDRAIINKQIQIHFTPGSDEIMPGSYFVLDALGDTMTSFGNTYLRVEGNTDATGSPTANMTLSERRALAVKNYIVKNFPNIDANRFQTIGRGSTNPVADNPDRSRPAAEPPHGHQGRSHDTVMAAHRKNSIWAIRQPVPRGTATMLAFVMPIVVIGAWCVISYGNFAPD